MNKILQKAQLLLWLGCLLAGTAACDKAKDLITPKLPDATQEGKVTFGCLVEDKVWLPYTESSLDRAIEAEYDAASNTFHLRAENEGNNPSYIHLNLQNASGIKPGTYTVGNGFSASYEASTGFLATATGGSGSVIITKVEPTTRTIGNSTTHYTIVSGTFEFTAIEAGTTKTVTIRDGRFDVLAR